MALQEDGENAENSSLDASQSENTALQKDPKRTQAGSACPVWCRNPWCIGLMAVAGAILTIAVTVVIYRSTFSAPGNLCCPNEWTRYGETCYFQSKMTAAWKYAQESCKAEGGSLLVLDVPTQEHIEELFTLKEDHWIGLRKDGEEWKWTDGSVHAGPVKYDGPHMGCAFLNGVIGALDCSSARRWICMKFL